MATQWTPTARQALARAIEDVRACGARVVEVGLLPDGTPWVRAKAPDGYALLDLIWRKAAASAGDPELAAFAYQVAAPCEGRGWDADGRALCIGARIHATVKQSVRFVPERDETFQRAAWSLRYRRGDCDDHAIAVAALALALGLDVRIAPFMAGPNDPRHVAAQIYHHGRWWWAETTIDARYGEHPFDALDRLGIVRTDIRSEAA